ncbi:bifunctional adenosylcobinamide kinase/adenosylcobinamide-phosphate guanylyltransferase [Nocardioides sp. S5]|uniref:bifunctional adenosylcobinamide kinase/adenosylcobinamide-phosphate guanylyltransferase n=1 Tax=Nocardioides sp. S5 TaxID=2017486 RepID=UPI001A8E6FAD|nr:bifunctional adenosylcobinamide kinase/adenosylcobinamide-phosphate guanylyltransferase [Nocardioides sp. S5]QSR30702.1 bifunctional adenosylcobinamide kinase/adenosylcobinamide-phosphate guanylyltransferase [Nocardioides sp. S5]
MRILVTGGVRSGKSTHAEGLIGDEPATYVAAGPTPDAEADPDWTARVAAHRARRPAAWDTVETQDLADALAQAGHPVLIDCLGTWLTAVIDSAEAWEDDSDGVHDLVLARTDELTAALRGCEQDVVLVTNEVGLGVVPEHRSGRLFRDLLGTVNQRVAAACDEVHLVVAGRVLRL